MASMTWEQLEATWRGLAAIMDNYPDDHGSSVFATLCEARRLVEVEMLQQGFTSSQIADLH